MQTRVLIADSTPLCLYGLKALLSHDPEISILETATDGETALRRALSLQPDVFLSEVDLPRLGGIAVFARVRQTLPAVHGMFLTTRSNVRLRQLAAQVGAAAFLTKDSDLSNLASMIRKVHAGSDYLRAEDPGRGARLDPPHGDVAHWRSVFSDREIFVLRQLVLGRTSRAIGAMLGRSHRTVDKQRESLRIKLDLHNTAALVAFGVIFLPQLDLLANDPEAPIIPDVWTRPEESVI